MRRPPIKCTDFTEITCKRGSFPKITFARGLDELTLVTLADIERAAGYDEDTVALAERARRRTYNVWIKGSDIAVAPSGQLPGFLTGRQDFADQIGLLTSIGVGKGSAPGKLLDHADHLATLTVHDESLSSFNPHSLSVKESGAFQSEMIRAALSMVADDLEGRVPLVRAVVQVNRNTNNTVDIWTVDESLLPGVKMAGGAFMSTFGYGNHFVEVEDWWADLYTTEHIVRAKGVYLDDHRTQRVTAAPDSGMARPQIDMGDGLRVIPCVHLFGGPQFTEGFAIRGDSPIEVDPLTGNMSVSSSKLGVLFGGAALLAATDSDEVSAEDKAKLMNMSVLCLRSLRRETVASDPELRTKVYKEVKRKGKSDGVKELRKQTIAEHEGHAITWAEANEKASGADASWRCYFGEGVDAVSVTLTVMTTGSVSATGDGHTGQIVSYDDALAYYLGGATVVNNHQSLSTHAFFNSLAGVEIDPDLIAADDADEFAEGYIHQRWLLDRDEVPAHRLAATDMLQFAANRVGVRELYNSSFAYGSAVTRMLTFERA